MFIPLLFVLAQTPPTTTKTPTRQIAAEQQATQALTPPEPPNELHALQPLEGHWRCEGEIPALTSKEGPEPAKHANAVPQRGTLDVQLDLAGHWYRFDSRVTPRGGAPRHESGRFGFAGDRFVLALFDSFGSAWRATATGWQLGKWTWEGEATVRGATLPFRQTLTLPEKGAFETSSELQVNGQWQAVSQLRCRR